MVRCLYLTERRHSGEADSVLDDDEHGVVHVDTIPSPGEAAALPKWGSVGQFELL